MYVCMCVCMHARIYACMHVKHVGKDQAMISAAALALQMSPTIGSRMFSFFARIATPKAGIPWIPMKVCTLCLCFQCSFRILLLPSACCGMRDTSIRPFSALCAYRMRRLQRVCPSHAPDVFFCLSAIPLTLGSCTR